MRHDHPSTKSSDVPILAREKALVRQAAWTYLQAAEPAVLAEFSLVFEPLWSALNDPAAAASARWVDGRLHADSPFDEESASAAVVWITTQLVRALVQASPNEPLVDQLARFESQLATYTGQRERVAGLTATLVEMQQQLVDLKCELQALRQGLAPFVPAIGRDPGFALSAYPHPDLRLIVQLESVEEPRLLRCSLVQGSDFKSFDPIPLSPDARVQVDGLFSAIEQLSQRDAHARQIAEQRLAGLCESLGERLLPPLLRQRLVEIADQPAPRDAAPTLHLISNETWIPWELLKLPARATADDGKFLSEAFALTRWLFDREKQVEREQQLELPLRQLALVVAKAEDLAATRKERDAILRLLHSPPARTVCEITPDYLTVTKTMSAGGHDGWHFCGHGKKSGENPDLQEVGLRPGETLTPSDLPLARGFGQQRPLVFLNACHSASGGPALTGIGGWARAFLKAGAGAFLGAHWAVLDASAGAFAEAFYREFTAGTPLAEAVRRARLELRASHPGDPTWLAYTAFAHPLARCGEQPATTASDDGRTSWSPPIRASEPPAPPAPRRTWRVLATAAVLAVGLGLGILSLSQKSQDGAESKDNVEPAPTGGPAVVPSPSPPTPSSPSTEQRSIEPKGAGQQDKPREKEVPSPPPQQGL